MKAILNFQFSSLREKSRATFTIFKKLASSKKQGAGSRKPKANGYTLLELYARRAQASKGYTLLELIVVMVLLIVVGSLIVGILSSTIRGSAKSKITNDLGQNGNYVLSIISDIILNSQNFDSITDFTSTTHTSCTPSGISGQSITVTGFDGGTTILSCYADTISSNSASLLDTSRVRLDPIPDLCKFTCVQADEYTPPRIDVTFTLVSANGNSSDTQGSATFKTSLSLRNISIK